MSVTKAEIPNVEIYASDDSGLVVLGTFVGAVPTTTNVFSPGAILIKTDVLTTGKKVYENDGTTASPSFNLVGDIVAAEIALAQDNLLVGNSSGQAEALAFLKTATTQALSGAGAVNVTTAITEFTSVGTGDALTLADGVEGQHKFVVYVAEAAGGDTGVLTPASLAGGTTVTFNDVGDSAHLLFTAGDWYFLGGSAVVA